MNLLEQLNDSQREAVKYCDGPALVIAGAGSGKTRVLTYKIAYLLQEGHLKPWSILALTFTNKAAREMKERIARLLTDMSADGAETARYLQMGTFHSIFARILRAEAASIGYTPAFTIYDQTDARSLVKNIVREMQLDDKIYKPTTVSDQISMAKNHMVTPQAFGTSSLFDRHKPKVSDIYIRYAERCRQANAMDFDDLLLNTYRLFAEHEDVRQKYAERFHYVLVDEYQDTNLVQQAIVLQLTRERQRVCVVGDDAQSIYSFRGANIDNILHFCDAYSGARLFKLEQNYRSTQHIVQAANSLIRKNERQIPKDVFSAGEKGEKLVLKPAYSDKEEALIVCNDIERIRKKEQCPYDSFAILYRTNAQSRSFEEQMRKQNIPYRIYGGLSFYQRKEIKDAIAYFRLVTNPNDEEALRRIINYPTRGIGDATVAKIAAAATARGAALWDVLCQPTFYGLQVSKATVTKLDSFRQMVEGWAARQATDDAYLLGRDIISQSGMADDIYSSHDPDNVARQENLDEFLGGMQDFVESRREEGAGDQVALTHYLQEVALLTDLDSDGADDGPKVSLMTIHAAKGLEFPTVFVVGLEENIFPSPMASDSMRAIEEERRLLYVAITRAEHHCILTCAQNRFRYGRMEFDTPSRFIRDIDPTLLRVVSDGVDDADTDDSRHTRRATERPSWAGSRSGSQNPRPVATQFVADAKPRAVPPRPAEKAEDPLSPSLRQMIAGAAARRFKPVAEAKAPRRGSSEQTTTGSTAMMDGQGALRVGCVIEHQRFGRGTVVAIEGNGENQKATVSFAGAGTKQLLMKFAKFTIV